MYNTFSPIVTNGLVLYFDSSNVKSYNGGSEINDLSPSVNVGVLTNGASFNLSNAITFDGMDDFIEYGDVLDLGVNSMTFNCWVKLNSNSGIQVLCSKSFQNTGNYRFNIAVNNQRIYSFMNATFDVEAFADTILPINEWIQITSIFDRLNGIKIYLNGMIDITTIPDISMWDSLDFQSNNPFRIGSYTDSDNITPIFNVNGDIALVQVYHRALSESEVLQNYNAQKNRFQS